MFGRRGYYGMPMFGGFFGSILPILAIILIVYIIVKVVNRRSPALILEEFNFSESADEFLGIRGRASGFWNWILSLLDKAPTTCFTFNKQEFIFTQSDSQSRIKDYIPLANITCVSSARLRSSVLMLVIGILLVIPTFGLSIILIIIWAINRKTIKFSIYTGENTPLRTITLKRGIIGSIDDEKFNSAVNALNKTVLSNIITK